MAVTYIDNDNGGWLTKDYTMDAADVARQRAGVDISGAPKVPMFSGFNNFSEGNSANALARTLTTQAQQQQTVTSQSAQAVTDANNATRLANLQLPGTAGLNLSDPAVLAEHNRALANTQFQRAALIPGGADMFRSLSGYSRTDGPETRPDGTQVFRPGVGTPLPVNGPGEPPDVMSTLLAGSSTSKALPANRMPSNLLADSRFRTLLATNPDNAMRFYNAVTGRDFKSDSAAEVAQRAEQQKNQSSDAADLAKKVITAPMDDPDGSFKKGEPVKIITQQGLVPGQVKIAYQPLTRYERGLYGQTQDASGAWRDHGNTPITQATGIKSDVDRSRDLAVETSLTNKQKNDAAADLAARTASPAGTYTPRGVPHIPVSAQPSSVEQSQTINQGGFGSDNYLSDLPGQLGTKIYNAGQSVVGGINNVLSTVGIPAQIPSSGYKTRAQMAADQTTDDVARSRNLAAQHAADYQTYRRTGKWPAEQYDSQDGAF